MVTIIVAICSCSGLIIIGACYKYVYLPIKRIRNKRKVKQDVHALPPTSNSPFVQVDVNEIHEILRMENSNLPELNSQHGRKISMDITSIPKLPAKSIPVKTNKLFKPTSVIIN